MKNMIEDLFTRYRKKGILVDTNILLLLFVGAVNRQRISQFSRTEKFTPEDYDILQTILLYFQKIVTTPNILTEVNSFANQLRKTESECFLKFSQIISKLDENYVDSRSIATTKQFVKFGLTDCGILNLAKDNYLVLTDDWPLSNYLQSVGIDVINFNHIRPLGWN